MFAGWTASVELSGAAAFAHNQAATYRTDVQARLKALSRPINLRHVDDQSVAALVATLDAIGDRNIADYRDHAIIASSRAIGRNMLAASMAVFETEGAWGVSPHIIPNGSLHSVSGLLSVALGMIGPNIGAGGVPGREGEAFVAAMSMLGDGIASKVWVILTGVDDESVRAVAITLRKADATNNRDNELVRLTVGADDSITRPAPLVTLESLFEVATHPDLNCAWSLPGGLTLNWRSPVPAEAAA